MFYFKEHFYNCIIICITLMIMIIRSNIYFVQMYILTQDRT